MTTTLERCQGCGRDTARLEDADQCPVCHLQYLTFTVQGVICNLDAIGTLVREAVVTGYAHPDDIREEVERVLLEPEVVGWVPKRRRWRDALAAKNAYAESLRAEVVD